MACPVASRQVALSVALSLDGDSVEFALIRAAMALEEPSLAYCLTKEPPGLATVAQW